MKVQDNIILSNLNLISCSNISVPILWRNESCNARFDTIADDEPSVSKQAGVIALNPEIGQFLHSSATCSKWTLYEPCSILCEVHLFWQAAHTVADYPAQKLAQGIDFGVEKPVKPKGPTIKLVQRSHEQPKPKAEPLKEEGLTFFGKKVQTSFFSAE